MPINVHYEGDVLILSNFARLMNDPRHFDASKDVRALLEEGHQKFVFDLSNLREIGDTGLGLLTTLTRLIRRYEGDAVLSNVRKEAMHYLDEMRMDAYWEIFEGDSEAAAYFNTM